MLAQLALSQARQAADTAAAWKELIPIMDDVAAQHTHPCAGPAPGETSAAAAQAAASSSSS
jgi:hypothetical protein